MATYKGIQGYSVQKLSSDPTASEAAGQLFYNSGTGKFKIATQGAGAWATGGNAINSFAQRGGAGIQTSALAFGGNAPGTKDETEKYDGTSWTEVADLNTARRYVAGAGATNTAALAIGGYDTSPSGYTNKVESWGGTSWTEITTLTTARATYAQAGGTQTAAITMGGNNPSNIALAEIWNGSTWTEVADLNTARSQGAGAGITTDAIMFGGLVAPEAQTETYNGTRWAEVGDLNTGRQDLCGSGSSTPNALAFAGYTTTNVANTESWNGTSWTELGDLATARREPSPGVFSANTASIVFNGYGPDYTNATEEWNDPVYTIKTVTVS